MKLSLIGMSNSGKTFWSEKLEEYGYIKLCCDDYIEYKLGSVLKKLGYRGISDVSKWLGQPYEERYQSNSKKYLKFEKESLEKFIDQVNSDYADRAVVIDTTGSVIYTGFTILKKLKNNTKIIYLDTPYKVQDEMYTSYLKEPKPVVWGESFNKRQDETDISALKRNYPKLLAYRRKEYERIADITLDYFLLRKNNFDVENFVNLIKE
ncbi:hypothetical protein HYW55_04790 [Candidatus Gottesmanbacteria bacterium]|nr:hypothetical protein [Candidatus Gottesmanbacteria bacterium]